jgi:hypothetical protein
LSKVGAADGKKLKTSFETLREMNPKNNLKMKLNKNQKMHSATSLGIHKLESSY